MYMFGNGTLVITDEKTTKGGYKLDNLYNDNDLES